MNKVDKQILSIQCKSRHPKHDIKILLHNVKADMANLTGIIVITECKNDKSRIYSSLDPKTTIVELETAKAYLINKRLEGDYEDEEEDEELEKKGGER